MDKIVRSYMEDFMKSNEIEEKDEHKQFEMFATYCTTAQQYPEQFDVSDLVTGAGGDCGIDGIAIIANGTLINTKEEIDDLIELNKKISDLSFIFVQAKTSAKFSSGEIGTFGNGVLNFFENETTDLPLNQFIKEKIEISDYIFRKSIHLKIKPKCYLYYVTTGKWVEDSNCVSRKNKIVKDLVEQNIFSDVKFIPVDADLIQKFYRNTIDVVEKEINFENKILLPDIEKVKQSYLGYLDCKEYLKLIIDDNEELQKSVFYDNVRDYQGENSVNLEIAESINNEPEKFVLLNNGVTIICKQLTSVRNKFTLTGYQIVNGCQTSHVLYYNRLKNESVLQIPVKIIETEDEETVNRIIKATNRQTEVTDEQLMALNEFHRKLEAYYNTYTGNKKLYYERRSKQYNAVTNIEKVRIVSISMQIKAAAAMFFDNPHLASRYYGKLVKSINGLFSLEHKMIPYYTCTYVLYRLEYLFRNKMLPAQYRKYRFHILMLMKYDFAKGKIPALNANKIEDLCDRILQCADDTRELTKEVNKLIKIIDKYVTDLNNQELTKSASLVDELKREINGTILH